MKPIEIFKIRAGTSNIYLLVNGNQSILIDAGNKGNYAKVLKALRQFGLKVTDISLIILTHTHYDHTGGLKKLKELTSAKVLVHEKESLNLEAGNTAIPEGTSKLTKLICCIGRNFFPFITKFPAVKPDLIFDSVFNLDQYGIDGYVIHTAGHTIGSVSIILAEKAFVGDAMMGFSSKKAFPHFANDIPELLKSWEKLLLTGCTEFYPGHGKMIQRKRIESELKYIQNGV